MEESAEFNQRIDKLELEIFTRLPESLRLISKTHFTPVRIAQLAAEWLTEDGPKKILDVGAGTGKFCIAGAIEYDSFFYGVEHRESLVDIANTMIDSFGLKNAKVLHQNILDVNFKDYDAFYMFNPYYENLVFKKRLNNEVSLSEQLHKQYTEHTLAQLREMPNGTRVVTYDGENKEIPYAYERVRQSQNGLLKLWVKQ